MKNETEKIFWKFINESDLSPVEVIEIMAHFGNIQEEFRQAKAEYVVFVMPLAKKERYFLTTLTLKEWVESNPGDQGLRHILEYIQKNIAANTVPIVVMDNDKKTVLLITFEFGGRINYVTIKK